MITGSGKSPGEGNGNPLQDSCPGSPMDREAWRATVYRVAKSQTGLKRLSTHTCILLTVSMIQGIRSDFADPWLRVSEGEAGLCPHMESRLEENLLLSSFRLLAESISLSVHSLSRVRFFVTSMDCSTPGFPVPQQLPELAQTVVHQVGDAIQPTHPLSTHSPHALSLSQNQVKVFPSDLALHSRWQK